MKKLTRAAFVLLLHLAEPKCTNARTPQAEVDAQRTMALGMVYRLLPAPSSETNCRQQPEWCTLNRTQAADTPPQITDGTVPSALKRLCLTYFSVVSNTSYVLCQQQQREVMESSGLTKPSKKSRNE